MKEIKTYEDFIETIQSGESETVLKDCVLSKDFDAKILSYKYGALSNKAFDAMKTILQNTLAQHKTKSDRLNFIEDCLRSFADQCMEYDYVRDILRINGEDGSHYFWAEFVISELIDESGVSFNSTEFHSIDAQIAYALLHKEYNMKWVEKQKFDAGNPLHEKLAKIAMHMEQSSDQSRKPFAGITERWKKDTMMQKVALREAQSASLVHADNPEILKSIKSGKSVSVDAVLGLSENDFQYIGVSELAKFDLDDIDKIYNQMSGYMSITQKVAVIELLINRAPADKQWYKKIWDFMVWSIPGYKKNYGLLFAFGKKFADVAKSIDDEYQKKLDRKNAAEKSLKEAVAKKQKIESVVKGFKAKLKDHNTYYGNIGDLKSNFRIIINSTSGHERDFYQKNYDLLEKIETGEEKSVAGITGHPWRVFTNRDEKGRFDKAKDLFVQLIELYKKPVPKWTQEDDRNWEMAEEELRRSSFFPEVEHKFQTAKKDYDSVVKDKDFSDGCMATIRAAEDEHTTILQKARMKIKLKSNMPMINGGVERLD